MEKESKHIKASYFLYWHLYYRPWANKYSKQYEAKLLLRAIWQRQMLSAVGKHFIAFRGTKKIWVVNFLKPETVISLVILWYRPGKICWWMLHQYNNCKIITFNLVIKSVEKFHFKFYQQKHVPCVNPHIQYIILYVSALTRCMLDYGMLTRMQIRLSVINDIDSIDKFP